MFKLTMRFQIEFFAYLLIFISFRLPSSLGGFIDIVYYIPRQRDACHKFCDILSFCLASSSWRRSETFSLTTTTKLLKRLLAIGGYVKKFIAETFWIFIFSEKIFLTFSQQKNNFMIVVS